MHVYATWCRLILVLLFLLLTLWRNIILVCRHGLDLTGDFLQSLCHIHLQASGLSVKDVFKPNPPNAFLLQHSLNLSKQLSRHFIKKSSAKLFFGCRLLFVPFSVKIIPNLYSIRHAATSVDFADQQFFFSQFSSMTSFPLMKRKR